MIETIGLRRSFEDLPARQSGPRRRGRRRQHRGGPGGDLRLPRPERRREDHDPADAHDPACPSTRERPRWPASTWRREPRKVRARIGYVSQLGGADDLATGRENLILQGRLYGGDLDSVTERAELLMGILDLAEFADRRVKTYSGGQRRRLDVALGIVHEPAVLFLDEPSTGLDPQNRANLWDHIRGLREQGTTIFLTTHYLEEADALCDRLVIMDHGQIVIEGTPRELKRQIAGDVGGAQPPRRPDANCCCPGDVASAAIRPGDHRRR